MKHRWPKDGTIISPNKTERECQNGCGIVKVSRHEHDGPLAVHWVEFWRGLDRIECKGTPFCQPILSDVAMVSPARPDVAVKG